MLVELRIQDFAIIEEVTLQFSSGFNVVTGETGAGKSILVDAVDFALGGHSDLSFVRSDTPRAIVELMFEVPPMLRNEIRSVLRSNDVEVDSLERIVMTRELRESGRTSGRINDISCKLPVYREIGGLLVDIHGQSEHLSLLTAKSHLYLLDRFADLEEPREALAELVRKLRAVRQTIASLQQNEREREQRIDMLRYQIEEIESARLVEGEEENLRDERNRLANAEKIASLAEEAYNALYGEDEFGNSGINAISRAVASLDKLIELDDTLEDEYDLAESINVQLQDLADSVRRYSENIEMTPGRLDEVEERLEIISRLRRKYGDTIKVILERADHFREELQNIELGEERLEQLQAEQDSLLRSIGDLARNLSKGRQRSGKKLSALVVEQLGHLRMENARFEVAITQDEDPDGCYVDDERLAFDVTGIDRLEFMLTANIGEPLKPLAQVASGGETARIMLALKSVLTAADHTPTLIFDEIDQGIGGRMGITVGEKLWGLSDNHQVLCVTHLAQIAGFADTHFHVSKGVDGKRTTTRVTLLQAEDRVREMAEMLGIVSESSMQNAQELYDTAAQIKKAERA